MIRQCLAHSSAIFLTYLFSSFFCGCAKALNKEKLEAKSPVELVNGARCRHDVSHFFFQSVKIKATVAAALAL